MSWITRSLGVSVCLALVACKANVPNMPTNSATTLFKGGLIPATSIALTPSVTLSLEKLVYWGGVAAIAYYVIDPQAPNWEIQEAKFPDDHYKLALKMKRYYSGGAGESRVVFNRRAKDLANANGYAGYRILEYSESLESNAIGSQRTSEGVIVLTGKVAPIAAAKEDTPVAVMPVPTFSPAPTVPPTLALAAGQQVEPAIQKPVKKAKPKPKKSKDDCK